MRFQNLDSSCCTSPLNRSQTARLKLPSKRTCDPSTFLQRRDVCDKTRLCEKLSQNLMRCRATPPLRAKSTGYRVVVASLHRCDSARTPIARKSARHSCTAVAPKCGCKLAARAAARARAPQLRARESPVPRG